MKYPLTTLVFMLLICTGSPAQKISKSFHAGVEVDALPYVTGFNGNNTATAQIE